MRIEQKREMLWTIGAYLFIIVFFILLAPAPKDILGIIIAGNVIGLIISLLKIRGEETSNERFVRKREENGPLGFWKSSLSESMRAFAYLFMGLMILAVVVYLTEGANLLQMLIEQPLDTIGILTLILVIVSFLMGMVFHAGSEDRYERLKRKLERQQ
ncbi:hypothetical protein [Saccharibacillus sacchari]|uniref:Uncharacterized protein n=1 Tax=Saccharibacillus sacchari TaxID=456493 RepID=A0ACC6P8Q2_9BACL